MVSHLSFCGVCSYPSESPFKSAHRILLFLWDFGQPMKKRTGKGGTLKTRLFSTAAVIVLVIAGLLPLAGCGKKTETGGGPDTVVVKFFEASLAEDADLAYELLSRESRGEVEDKKELVEGFSESLDSYSVGHPDISGDKARVPVTLKLKAFESELKFDMILITEDGAWRISMPESEAEMEKAMEEIFKGIEPPD